MNSTLRSFLLSVIIIGFLTSCGQPKVIKNLNGQTYSLVNSDSTSINFPKDFKGNVVAVTFIYTHCPDVCPLITANLINIQNKIADTTGVHFVEISFDPSRDTPSVLQKYRKLYKLNGQFSLLTGDSASIDPLLNDLDIKTEKTYPDSADTTSDDYFITHTNRLYLMDRQGRIRFQYTASVVPPETVISDINNIR